MRKLAHALAVVVIAAGNAWFAQGTAYAAPADSDQIVGGYNHACMIRAGDEVWCWGADDLGQVGDGEDTGPAPDALIAVPVDTTGALSGKTVRRLAAGGDTTCALDAAGAVYCWGRNNNGQLGIGSTTMAEAPVAVDTTGALAGRTVTDVAVGDDHVCVIAGGAAYCWGDDDNGQLGNDGALSDVGTPAAVDATGVLAAKTLVAVDAGANHTCVLDQAGAVYCWGDDSVSGQLGNNAAKADQATPVAVDPGVFTGPIASISAGGLHTCALDNTGKAYCWGETFAGQLGQGSPLGGIVDETTPVVVSGGHSFGVIAAGEVHTCALTTAGVAYCWGENFAGQVGDNGLPTDVNLPTAVDATGVLAGRTLTGLTAGQFFTCVQDSVRHQFCWGDDDNGQLGADTSGSPVDVPVAGVLLATSPRNVTATPGDGQLGVSWSVPLDLGTGTLVGYAAAALPGPVSCPQTTATTCTITGLSNGSTYSVAVFIETSVGLMVSDPISATAAAEPPLLAVTGVKLGGLVAVGLLMLGLGASAVVRTRRRGLRFVA